jgi:hypothetical protein
MGFFPVTSHTRAMIDPVRKRKNEYYIPIFGISSNQINPRSANDMVAPLPTIK